MLDYAKLPFFVDMSKLRDYFICTGILLGLALNEICLAQNVSFPQDVTIRRSIENSSISQYVVYVSDPINLPRVKIAAPDAFISSLDSGQKVVQIGRFNNLDFAQKRIEELRRANVNAQVTTAKVTTQMSSSYPTSIPIPNSVILPDVPSNLNRNANNGANILTIPPAVTPLPPETLAVSETAKNRYFVIIPSTSDAVLGKAQTIMPMAKLTSSDRGTYIEVQSYPDRSRAETLNATMRSQGLDSRVIYF